MSEALGALRGCLGPGELLTDPDLMAPFLREVGGRECGEAIAVATPSTLAQVSALVRVCNERQIAIIPQGGNTGLTGAGLPRNRDRHLLLSLRRMKAVRSLDAVSGTVIVEAGCPLTNLQEHAKEAGLCLPLGLGSEGSCTVGGIASTNAGGLRAVRYGNARENILGIEAVLPDGSVFEGLRTLRKNNTGYDLKQLFIGAEGTLGIITAVAMRLVPMWEDVQTALVACPSIAACGDLFYGLRNRHSDALVAFEVIDRNAMELAVAVHSAPDDPFAKAWPAYALIELASAGPQGAARSVLEDHLSQAMESDLVGDALIAASARQGAAFWSIREAIVEGQRGEGYSVKLDICVPVGRVAEFIDETSSRVLAIEPDCRPVAFGHFGDGNVHFSVLPPKAGPLQALRPHAEEIARCAHDIALSMGGSISAEHGIGYYKRDEFDRTVLPVERDLMRRIKDAIDPRAIMNPGAILSSQGSEEPQIRNASR